MNVNVVVVSVTKKVFLFRGRAKFCWSHKENSCNT